MCLGKPQKNEVKSDNSSTTSEIPNKNTASSSTSESKDKIELLYEGYYYDVTHWVKKHPGGDIIKLYTNSGEDSTLAVQQFHFRAIKNVMMLMNTFPRRVATEQDLKDGNLDSETIERHRILTKDFQLLTKELVSEGFMTPDPLRYIKRLLQAFLIFNVGLAMSFFLGPTAFGWRVLSALIISLAAGQSLWLVHEGGHNAFMGIPKIDRILQTALFGCVFGLSASSWNSTHSEHHAMPQHVSNDADLNTLPLLAFNKKLVKKQSLAKSFWLQNQKWLFVLCDTFIVVLTWKFNHHIKFCIRNGKWFDLFCMLTHYSLVPLLGFYDWLFITWVSSVYILGNLVLSHTHFPVVEEGQKLHWVEYAFIYTTNVRSSWWVDWWMHLNYQIEHHLFPTMPEYKNRLCCHKVKAFAKKHNLPYNLCSYWQAVKSAYHNLGNVSEELKHMM